MKFWVHASVFSVENGGIENMNIRKIAFVLLAFLLTGMAMVPMVSAAASAVNYIDSKTAEDVAAAHMKEMPGISAEYADWTEGSVEKSTTYYDLDDNEAAYLFNVNVKKTYAGYILVSSNKDNFPVLEFSRGKVPDAESTTMLKSKAAVQSSVHNKNLHVGSPKMVYLGGTFYYAKYPIKNSKGVVVENRYVDLMGENVVDPAVRSQDNQLDAASLARYQEQRIVDIKNAWQAYDARKTEQTIAASELSKAYGYSTISGIPLWPYTLGCCPTSGGLVLSYWRTHGYSSIPSSRSTLAQELYTAMGTNPAGQTSIWNVDNGMNTVISNHGYSYSSLHIDEDSWVSYDEVQREINAVKPFTLTMTAAGAPVGGTQSYRDHSVAVVGYSSSSSGNFIIINDGLSTSSTKTMVFGNWAGAIAGYSRPA